ncbi:uncharacterized protein LOC105909796 [Clupea harengus]|uniref:Uncharacterized protein LOC105909796 n=1 Tax=Clupea harengus TaxID=7950 RepID=A0A6P8GLY8_CLUHA|nr:uncharacterized protein LOC105909796 [Clupea harengus]
MAAGYTYEDFKLVIHDPFVKCSLCDYVTLPCHLSPETSAVAMEIRWFKGTDCIYLYKNGHVTVREDYEGRVSVNTLELQRGDASLTLIVSREEDKGLYTCQVISGEHKEEGRVRLLARSASEYQSEVDLDLSSIPFGRLIGRLFGLTMQRNITDEERMRMEESVQFLGNIQAVSPYESVGLLQLELRELAQAVIGPLKSGLHSFNNVSDMLLSVNADIVLPGCRTFNKIRQEIKNMKQQMEKSELVAGNELQRLDWETERLTAEQSHLANERRQREGELGTFKTQLESHRSSLESYNEALRTEKRNLESAEDTLRRQRQRRDEAETIRNAGFFVTLIPIAGWIAGPAMMIGGQIDMIVASEAAGTARREIENCESQVRSYSGKVSEYWNLIHKAVCDIQEVDCRIREMEAKRRGVSVKREVVADVQAKMRRTVHQLGLLCGVGSAAELQTRRLILLEPVMKVMEEMTTALGQITGDDLLHTEGIKSLMWDMKKNQNKLRQLADTRDTGLYNEYY